MSHINRIISNAIGNIVTPEVMKNVPSYRFCQRLHDGIFDFDAALSEIVNSSYEILRLHVPRISVSVEYFPRSRKVERMFEKAGW